jgi:hypothetical protein
VSDLNLDMMARMDEQALKLVGEERDLRPAIEAYARNSGWLVHHERMSGHRDAGTGRWRGHGAKGRPDLLLAREGVIWLWELKPERGELTVEQGMWLMACATWGRLFRPRHAAEILSLLTAPPGQRYQ